MTPKNPKKWCFFYRDGFLYNNKRAYFKKGLGERVALNMSFQTKKKIYDFILNSGRMVVALRRRIYLLRETRNNFSKRFFVVLSFFKQFSLCFCRK